MRISLSRFPLKRCIARFLPKVCISRSVAVLVRLLLSTIAVAGCGGDTVTRFAPATGSDAAGLYWALTVDHRAITLSIAPPYDTLQITATPRDADGHPLSGLGTVTYRSVNPELVLVSPSGRLQALKAGTAEIDVELSAGSVRHTDRAFVNVTEDEAPPALASLSILPEPPDSTTWGVNGDGSSIAIQPDGSVFGFAVKILFARAADAGGTPIPGINVSFSSSDTTVAVAGALGGTAMLLQAIKPGRVTVIANATVYGVTMTDSVPFTMTMPVYAVVKIQSQPTRLGSATAVAFNAADVTVTPGGSVVWVNLTGQPADVVFDDPTNVIEHGSTVSCAAAGVIDPGGAGDIAAFGEPRDPQAPTMSPENCRSRSFPVAGVYPYHSNLTGATGRVVVNTGVSTP
jgi:plastocyanin